MREAAPSAMQTSDMERFTTARGRPIRVIGSATLLTRERSSLFEDLFDADPRVASVSLVFSSDQKPGPLRATSPAGPVICVAEDLTELTGPLSDQEIDQWASRAAVRGLTHLWVVTNSPDAQSSSAAEESEIDRHEMASPSSRQYLGLLRKPSDDISIAIDATWLGEHETGAQVLTTAATAALARNHRVSAIHLRGIDYLPGYATHLTTSGKVHVGAEARADVCWFPNQIDFRSNVGQARVWGSRVVTTYLDLIAYTIPRYHASHDAWLAYRKLQRVSALASDGITTISADVAQHLLDEVPLLEQRRVRAIHLGMDHITGDQAPSVMPPDLSQTAGALNERSFLLVLGNDFIHKNRDFAISVWQELLQRGHYCDLVLAGLHVGSSSSRSEETSLLRKHVDLRGSVITLDHVSSDARLWLLAHAAAVLYPSSAEGFGLVPYEAAALGTPSTFTGFGPLGEISQIADVPTTWNVDEYASDVASLLTNPETAARRISQLRDAASRHTWDTFADDLLDFMFDILALPPTSAGALLAETTVDVTALNALLSSKTWRALAPIRSLRQTMRRQPRG